MDIEIVTNKILDFWFSNKDKWFIKSPDFDAFIKENYLLHLEYYKEEEVNLEEITAKNILALIVLFDQFPRNMFRGSRLSFATDKLAEKYSLYLINKGLEKELNEQERKVVYMPLMHAENVELQQLCVKKFEEIKDEVSIDFARQHLNIIEKFGRFPHRNEALNRESTEEELDFLKDNPGF